MPGNASSAPGGFRLLGHPVHPLLTDFPIALWSASLLADLVGLWRGREIYGQFAFWAIALGLIIAAPTIVTGLIDYAAIAQQHPALESATWHMWIMLSAATAYACSFIARLGHSPSIGLAVGLSVLGLLLLLLGGWFGGELVFRHGVGSRGDSSSKDA